MRAHALAEIFPLIEGEAFDRLVADIKANGLVHPIVLFDGKILDGRNRWRACKAARVEPKTTEYKGKDPVAYVISTNVERRQLSETQRSAAAAKLAQLKRGRPENASIEAITQEEAAAKFNVSRSNVQRARKVLDLGAPELIAAVEQDVIAVSDASRITSLPKEQQAAIVHLVVEGTATNVAQAVRQLDHAERVAASEKVKDTPTARIIHGDAVEEVARLDRKPHLVVTDPPYGLSVHRTRQGGKDYSDGDHAIDLLDDVCARLVQALDEHAHIYVFSGYSNVHAFKRVLAKHFDVQDNPLIWVKGNHTMCDFAKNYPNKHEYILFAKMRGSKRKLASCVPDVLTIDAKHETEHSAEKPVDLISILLEQSSIAGELVLDPFAGSGATGVACARLRRHFVGIEMDESWSKIARARVAS